jgi:hypothetical protein
MKVYLDENMPHQLAEALNIIQEALNHQEGTNIEVTSISKEFGTGAKDEEWIPKITGSIVITQDYRIQRSRHQRDLYEKHQLGMVYIKPPSKNGLSFWDMTQLIIKRWDEIRKLAVKKKFPFAVVCSSVGKLKDLD